MVRPKTFKQFAARMEAALSKEKCSLENRVLKVLWRHVRSFWDAQKDLKGDAEEVLFAKKKIKEYGQLLTAYRRCIKAIDYAITKADIAVGRRDLKVNLETLEYVTPPNLEDWRFEAEKLRGIIEAEAQHRKEFIGVWLLHIPPSLLTDGQKKKLISWIGSSDEQLEDAALHYMWFTMDQSLQRYPPDNAERRYRIICCASGIAGYWTSVGAIKIELLRQKAKKLP